MRHKEGIDLTIRRYVNQLKLEHSKMKTTLEKIASCKSVVKGDVVDLAQQVLKEIK